MQLCRGADVFILMERTLGFDHLILAGFTERDAGQMFRGHRLSNSRRHMRVPPAKNTTSAAIIPVNRIGPDAFADSF